jgi:hypothetical protein
MDWVAASSRIVMAASSTPASFSQPWHKAIGSRCRRSISSSSDRYQPESAAVWPARR